MELRIYHLLMLYSKVLALPILKIKKKVLKPRVRRMVALETEVMSRTSFRRTF